MATRKTDNTPAPEPSSNRGPLIVLGIGSIAVAALVGWALTRTVEPAVPPPTSTFAAPPVEAAPPAAETSTTSPQHEENVPRIEVAELKELVDRGGVTLIDVRDSVSYTNGHIPGAIHIPFARVQAEAGNLPKDKPIVAYCT